MAINCYINKQSVDSSLQDAFIEQLTSRLQAEFPDSALICSWAEDTTSVEVSSDEYEYVQINAKRLCLGIIQDIIIFGIN